MAAIKCENNNLDSWRKFFSTCNADIFEIIQHGIMVAAADRPEEFRLRRDGLAETLFSSKLSKCVDCGAGVDFKDVASKESKVDSRSDDLAADMNMNQNRINYSYGDAEALNDDMEKESQILREVSRLKLIVENYENEYDSSLLEALRRLELMTLSVEILKATEIGKAVNALKKHSSKDIRNLARTLVMGWKIMVEEWVKATEVIAAGYSEGNTPDSVNPSVLDEEEGLPLPPMDDLSFFGAPPTSMELSQFFDGLDDDLNPQNCGEINKIHASGRKPPVESQKAPKGKKDEQEVSIKKQNSLLKPNKPSTMESGPGRHATPSAELKVHCETKVQKKPENVTIQKPQVSQQNKSREEAVKLEATKRKLQENYQQVENAKRQRTIQVMELHDLPKQGLGRKNSQVRPVNNRNGRR